MFSILDRYIGKTIISTIGISLFLLISLSGIIRFIDQLRRIKVDYDAFAVGIYSLLMVPKDLEVFFPMAALLGALIGLGMLASRSELIVMETAGFSRFKIALAVMKTALPLVLITMAIGEWVAPVSEQTARNMRSEKLYGSSLLAQQGRSEERRVGKSDRSWWSPYDLRNKHKHSNVSCQIYVSTTS